MQPTGYQHAAKQGATAARGEARSDTQSVGRPALLFYAEIIEATAGSTHTICPIDDTGERVKQIDNPSEDYVIEGVRSVPTVEWSEGEIVWCVRWEGHDLPVIFGASGGGCAHGYEELGILMN